MKARTIATAAMLFVAGAAPALTAAPCEGQGPCMCSHHTGMGAMGGPMGGGPGWAGHLYDPDTVTTLSGRASEVIVVPARGGRSGGLHLTLDSDGEARDVHLGPAWFLRGKGLDLAKGDAIEVTGSLVQDGGEPFLVAREVKKGDRTVTLRDEQGVPLWSGPRTR